ncbi:histidine phosphatase family protein [Parafrankia sp. BMG5.11]|uniref:histidine phosphatase family protein n=1 Tax=Parafrankia sp. BMG5.11 TaxID=222540 RepID=UPI0010394E9D|nr:histidine phosphatase family protein [Parafrankia sp. BMG5.11]TCJ32063.1 histidine phosphatase family protein [Parafrankia sp. BMG5.11]CAI7973443.1 Histidine phosphatase family protein [Frankia sp. Hr75.2]
METDLLFARHGEAHCNLRRVAGGEIGCTGLTERGRDQARQLGRRLRRMHDDQPFDAVYVSSRRRARETAELATGGLGVPVTVEPALAGPQHGVADGRPWTEIWAAFGASPGDEPDRPFAEGAESWNQYLARAMAALGEIIERHPEQRVLVVAHAETVEAAHTRFLRLPSRPGVGFAVAHCSITWWSHRAPEFGAARWQLVKHNSTRHLDQIESAHLTPAARESGP